jgi:hypothetical protein
MAKVKIATKKQTGFGCPTVFKGLVTVDGQNKNFEASYRYGRLSVEVNHADVDVDDSAVSTPSDGVCSWDDIKDTVLASLRAHFN